MKLLLIEPRYCWPGGNSPWSPWGKMQLAAYMRKHGFTVSIMDNALFRGTDESIRNTILHENPDIIGIGGMTVQRTDTLHLGRLVKDMYAGKPNRPLLACGGSHFTFCPEDAFESFDLVVSGEGEETFRETCDRFKETWHYWGDTYKGVLGLGYRQDPSCTAFTHNAPRPLLDVSKICAPAFDLVPWLTQYGDGFIDGQKAPMLMTGRGCPYDCTFCAAPALYQRKSRLFPMDMVKDIMLQMRKLYGNNDCRIMDDTFAIGQKRVAEFCEMVKKDIGPLRLSCLTHCKTVDLQTLKLMKETGVWVVAYGVESANNEVLNLINKKMTVEDAIADFELTRQAGICIEGLFMIGNIGDTEKTVTETIEFARKYNHPSQYLDRFRDRIMWNWFQFATPFPGSKFYTDCEKYGKVLTRDLDKYHHQEPVFVPTGMTAQRMVELRAKAFEEIQ